MSRKKNAIPAHGRNVRRPVRARKSRYLVVCGGQVTEPQYFSHLKSGIDDSVIDIKPKVMAPVQLAKYAVRCKNDDSSKNDSRDRYAAVFVVVDVDDFHDHGEAQKICDKNDIYLIISNPCFEVWLIDHVQMCPSSCVTTADVERYASDHHITNGARNKYINFKVIDGHVSNAFNNAERHNTKGKTLLRKLLIPFKERDYAPWTDMSDVISILMRTQLIEQQ